MKRGIGDGVAQNRLLDQQHVAASVLNGSAQVEQILAFLTECAVHLRIVADDNLVIELQPSSCESCKSSANNNSLLLPPSRRWLLNFKVHHTLDLGGERQNCIKAIFALVMRVGPPAECAVPCGKTRPLTSSVSSIVPPSLLTTLMLLKSTSVAVAGSITSKTALTAMGAKRGAFCDTTWMARNGTDDGKKQTLLVQSLCTTHSLTRECAFDARTPRRFSYL
jgi:hypothetical protein